MCGKIIVLKQLVNMFLTNQTSESFKLENLLKRFRDQVDFLFADKHQSFPQIGTIVFGGSDIPKVHKIRSVQ